MKYPGIVQVGDIIANANAVQRQIRQKAAIKGEMTKYANRVARHRATWGQA